METDKNQHELAARIEDWKHSLSHSSLTRDDVEELALHLKDTYNELLTLNLSEEETWLLATHRIGKPESLNDEFQDVNTDFVQNNSWLMLLWGAVSLLVLQAIFIILPLIFRDNIIKMFKPKNTDAFLTDLYYTLAVAVLMLFALIIAKNGYIIRRFSKSLTKYTSLYAIIAIVAGLWAAFFSYLVFARYPLISSNTGGQQFAFKLLTFGFYFPLVTLSVFSTIRYFSYEVKSFNFFKQNINWKHALILGMLAQTPVQFSYGLPGNDMIRITTVIIISVIIYGFIGWLISHSQKGIKNLAFAQATTMFIWILGSIINDNVRILFLIFYIAVLLSLAAGYYTGRLKHTSGFSTT